MIKHVLRQLSAQVDEPIVVTDAQGRVEWVNGAFTMLCGYDTADLAGRKPGDVLQGPETNDETVARIHDAVEQGNPFAGDILNYHADGYSYWVRLNIAPIRDSGGEISAFVAIEKEIRGPAHPLPIQVVCMFCRNFDDPEAGWMSMEAFHEQHMQRRISHGICPQCAHKWPE